MRVFAIVSDRHFTPSSFRSQTPFIDCPTVMNIAKYYKNVCFSQGDSFERLSRYCPGLRSDESRRSHEVPPGGFSKKNYPIFQSRQKAQPCPEPVQGEYCPGWSSQQVISLTG